MRPLVALLVLAAALVLIVSVATPDARDAARRLDSDSAAERDAAARRLAALGEDARETLNSMVATGSPEARRRARVLLADLDAVDDVVSIRRLEARALVRRAVRRGGLMAAGSAIDGRLGELQDESAQELAAAAERRSGHRTLDAELVLAVARHPSTEGVAALARALRGERVLGSDVVRAARLLPAERADLLTDAARQDLDAVLEAHGDPRRRAAAALLLALEPRRAPRLAADLDSRVRLEAAHALRRLGLAGARTLERLASDEDDAVRRSALDALADVPGAPRPRPAERAATSPDAGIRAAAARLLGRDAVPASLPLLASLAADDSPRVRAAAERSLAALGRR